MSEFDGRFLDFEGWVEIVKTEIPLGRERNSAHPKAEKSMFSIFCKVRF